MTSNACNPVNVASKIAAIEQSRGAVIDAGAIESMGPGAVTNFTNTDNSLSASILKSSTPTEAETVGISRFENSPESTVSLVGRVLADQKRPSSFLGEDLIGQLNEAIENIYLQYGRNNPEGRAAYDQQIGEILDSVDTTQFTDAQYHYFNDYAAEMKRGGSLYQTTRKTGAGQVLSNIADNTIKSSFTVAVGQPMEIAIKLPALYGDTVFDALSTWASKGEFFKKIDELDALGYYSVERQAAAGDNLLSKVSSNWAGINEYLDIPWKNLVYTAGVLRGGHQAGLKALDDVLFIPRWADIPRQRWNDTGRVESRFLSYSVSSARLSLDLISKSVGGDQEALKSLLTMAAMGSLLGGPGALIPEPIEQLISKASPESGDIIRSMQIPGTSGLIQQQGIGRISIASSIMETTLKRSWKLANDGVEKLNYGDPFGGSVDMAFSLVPLMSMTQNPMGDAMFQKLLYTGREALMDDFDAQDTVERFFPFTKQ